MSGARARLRHRLQGQVAALGPDTDVVTLSIGGNDIGWSQAVGACLGGTDAQCGAAIGVTRGRITGQLPALLDAVYDEADAAAPDATVYVTGYPRLSSSAYGAVLGASPAEPDAMNEGADRRTCEPGSRRRGTSRRRGPGQIE